MSGAGCEALANRISQTERAAGKRASYHVYYDRNGRRHFDPSWAATADSAARQTLAALRTIYPKAALEIVRIVPCNPSITVQ